MTSPITGSENRHSGEGGYVLVGVIFLVALVLVALAVAAPKVAVEIQRDKETELLHRGKQYTRAIRLYYRKFGRYPISISQLENTNNIKFLRKKYKDPFTGKDEWRIIHFGEAKVPTTGLFGQPLTATSSTGSTSATGSSITGGSYSGGSSMFGASSSPTSTGASSGATGSTSSSSDNSSSGFGSSSSFGSSGSTGSTNSTIGGGAMIGVASTSKKASLKEFKKQKHYNEWEFVYDPLLERLTGGNGTSIMAPTNSGTNPLSNSSSSSSSSSTSNQSTSGTSNTTNTNPQ